ncbi:MAG: hypothetical protein Kow0092_07630 [Deferrisomatales bacterium]
MLRAGTLLAGALLLSGAVHAAEPGWRLAEVFGERGRGRTELREPVDVALAPGGDVAVLDREREAVVIFSGAGKWRRTLGGPRGEGQLRLQRPTALAVDGAGRFWVVDSGNHRLVVFDEAGEVFQTVGELGSRDGRFRHPSDVAFDRKGRVYVADTGNDRVQVFDVDGRFLASWDRRTGGRRDHLERPERLAFSERGRGELWVLNRGWSRLEQFNVEGDWEASLPLEERVEGELEPVDLEIEPAFYRLFVADAAGGRVLAFDRNGRPRGEIRGPEPGGMIPAGLAVNRRMDVFVVDAAGARVLRFETQ